jgi:GNAT superfamily N-acetyltransferase
VLERWFPNLKLPMSFDDWERLPQNPAYKYEYANGRAELSGRPKTYRCVLDLKPASVTSEVPTRLETVRFRGLTATDWDALPIVFISAFCTVPPFAQLSKSDRLEAAMDCLQCARSGIHGPILRDACFVAIGERGLRGAALVVLMPDIDLPSTDERHWIEPWPDDAIEKHPGCPQLLWTFVHSTCAREGIGTALLSHVCHALLALGYGRLASAFLLGNERSTLWHWSTGFRLVPWSGSSRR